jgi:hypothetical protein
MGTIVCGLHDGDTARRLRALVRQGTARRMFYAVLTLLASLPQNAFAVPGWTPCARIEQVQLNIGALYIQLDPVVATSTLNNCSYFGGRFVLASGTTTMNAYEMAQYTTALAASTAGKLVSIYSGGCGTTGHNRFDNLAVSID